MGRQSLLLACLLLTACGSPVAQLPPPVPRPCAAIGFAPAVTRPVISQQRDLVFSAFASGDFDGNGRSDLAVTMRDSSSRSTLFVFLTNPDGSLQPGVTYDPGSGPSRLLTGDFDGDGTLDLAVGVSTFGVSHGVRWLSGLGDGTFLPVREAPVDGYDMEGATVFAAADFNGDHRSDLAVVKDGVVSILLAVGGGRFQAADAGYAIRKGVTAVAVDDFNRDGRPDLAVGDVGGVSILLGDGQGGFASPVPYAGQGGGADGDGVGAFVYSVASGDLNGDGAPDLALSIRRDDGGGLNIARVLLNRGDGTFGPPIAVDHYTGGPRLAIADLNNDGKGDLAVANFYSISGPAGGIGDSMSTLLGNGDGTFQPPTSYAVGTAPGDILLADLNGDGRPDAAVTNTADLSVSTLVGTCQ
jgi:hypothetical protein